EGNAEAVTVSIAETRPVDGTVRLVGVSVNVTPAGAAPLQAALSCTKSVTPLTERRVISEVLVEEAVRFTDRGAAEAKKSNLLVLAAGQLARKTSRLWSAFWPGTRSASLLKAIFVASALIVGRELW